MASRVFSDIKCGEPLKGMNVDANAGEIAKKMGLDQTCSEDMLNRVRTKIKSGSWGLGLLSVIRNNNTLTDNIDEKHREGCGRFLLDLSNILEQVQNIKCVISENENNSTVNVSGTNTIKIETLPLSPWEVKAKSEADTNALMGAAIVSTKGGDPEIFNKTVQLVLKGYDRTLTMNNANLTQTVNTTVKTLGSFKESQISQIEQAYEEITKTVVNNNVERTIGVNATDDNVREVVNNNTQKNLVNATQNINKTLNSLNLVSTGQNEFTLKVPGAIELNNFTLDQEAILDLAATMIVDDAIKDGLKTILDVSKDIQITKNEKTTRTGLDDLIENTLTGTAENTRAQNSADIVMFIVIGIVALIMIMAILYFMLKKGGGGGGGGGMQYARYMV